MFDQNVMQLQEVIYATLPAMEVYHKWESQFLKTYHASDPDFYKKYLNTNLKKISVFETTSDTRYDVRHQWSTAFRIYSNFLKSDEGIWISNNSINPITYCMTKNYILDVNQYIIFALFEPLKLTEYYLRFK